MVSTRAVASGLLVALVVAGAQPQAAEATPTGEFEVKGRPIWAGEIIELGVTWRVDWDAFSYLEGPLAWDPGQLIVESWRGPVVNVLPASAGPRTARIDYRTRALALQPGTISFSPARQVFIMKTGSVRMSDYERAVTEPVTARTEPALLEARPLPPAPEGFLGAVGRFKLTSSVTPQQPVVGQKLTWTLTLSGVGNWPSLKGLPSRRISSAFESAGPARLTETPGATMFEQSIREEVDLVPTMAGRHVLGPVEMPVFDPSVGRYVRLSSAATILDVSPVAKEAAKEGEGRDQAARLARTELLPPLLAGSGTAQKPMTNVTWWAALLFPFTLVAAVWLLLAVLRAYRDDPERQARKSHAMIGKTLRQLEHAATASERRRLIRLWQHHVGLRWKLGQATPIAASFSGHGGWRDLWSEADLFLYGRSGAMPPDWMERAQRLWHEHGRPPKFEFASVFSRRNLYPLALAAGLTLLPMAHPVQAAPVAGEQHFREVVERRPVDWKARYNLAVSLAAGGRLQEAAAHAAIAWVQHPSSPATRALWTKLARQAGFPSGGGSSVPRPTGWWGAFLSSASPAQWQILMGVCLSGGALGAVWILFVGYGAGSRKLKAAGFAFVATGAIGAGASYASLQTYGVLTDRDAVVLWQGEPLRALPVEDPLESGTVMVEAGSAARVNGHFLGWRRLQLSNGSSGWVRRESLLWAWHFSDLPSSPVRSR